MKKIVFLLSLSMLFACKNDDDNLDDNPFLTSPLVNLNLNLNLPEYNSLNFPSNSLVVTRQGIRGVVIYNVDNTTYHAFELSDPNHVPTDCSRMEIDGIEATCPCDDDNKYNIITGQNITDPSRYPMQRYRAVRSGNTISITN
ncbi:hypothetical protein [uncultured Marixanthomonas sp.]|uniref:hypothetical protein n=1 Tax=uncultured Marixanthomonas sp. TaxID=757245 RepID=UPI0030DD9F66|tara:strand:+ start:32219 stop:32647 length:429 start_codon:yes stop_codon:yes gene_type:complete